jgi:hypothetical protein
MENNIKSQPKAKKEFTKKYGVFQFNLQHNERRGIDSMTAFRVLENKEGKRKSLRLIVNQNCENLKNMVPGEYWHVEYYESDDRNYAECVPIEKADTKSKISISKDRDRNTVGLLIYAEGTEEGQYNEIFKAVFPENRQFTKVQEELIKKKIDKFKLHSYEDEIVYTYRETLEAVRQAEIDANNVANSAAKIIEEMDSEEVEGQKVSYQTPMLVISHINKKLNPYSFDEDFKSAEELAAEAIDELNIVAFDKARNLFKVTLS